MSSCFVYRTAITKLHPSLPHQAGKAYAHFEQSYAQLMYTRSNPRPPNKQLRHVKGGEITVRSVVNPKSPEMINKVARAVLKVAERLAREELDLRRSSDQKTENKGSNLGKGSKYSE